MQELKLRHEIMSKVFDGTKHSTSRRGIRDTTLGPLKLVETENPDVSIIVDVVSIQAIPFNKISDKEAFDEGYSNAEELKQTLRNIYGEDFSDDEFFTIVEWASIAETEEERYSFWQHEGGLI